MYPPTTTHTFLFLISVTLIFSSCKKDQPLTTEFNKAETIKNSSIVLEKVDSRLLDKYVDYQLKVEATAMLKKAGKDILPNSPKMNKQEFDLMIENYLANERNMLLMKTYSVKKQTTIFNSLGNDDNGNPGEDIPDDGEANPPSPFSGHGNYPGSTITNILFSGSISNNGTISQQAFGFAGVHGAISPVGSLSQSVYNGVTTYQQNFQEVINLTNGGVYTQLFVVYGNIYNGTVTVSGMSIPNN